MQTNIRGWVRRRVKTLRWLAWVAGLGLTAACQGAHATAPTSGDYEVASLRYQGFAGAVSLPELAEELGYLAPLKLNRVGDTISGPQDIQATVTGDVDFGAAFNGAIINLVAAKAPLVAVVGFSFLDEHNFNGFYVREDSALHRPRDLIGKQVAMNTVGAHAEFMLKEWLTRGGLSKAEIKQVTLLAIPPLNAEGLLRKQQVDVAALGAILRDKALEHGPLRPLFTDYELFGRLSTASYVMRRDFVRDKPRAAGKLVDGVARAIEWTRNSPRDVVVARLRHILATRGRGEDPSLVDYFQPSSSPVPGGLLRAEEFQLWIDWLVKDGQLSAGQVRASDTFTNQLNPYAVQKP